MIARPALKLPVNVEWGSGGVCVVAWSEGDRIALDELMPLVDRELRRIARQQFAREHPDHTLQPTALVNEAYLRLIDQHRVDWQNRAHFFAVAARLMRVHPRRSRSGSSRC